MVNRYVNFRFIFALLLVFNSVVALPADAGIFKQTCDHVLSATAQYGKELIETRGLRLFFKPQKESVTSVPYGGFLTRREDYYADNGRVLTALKNLSQFLPRRIIGLWRGTEGHFHDCLVGDPEWVFTPGRGLNHCLLDKPIDMAAKRLKTKNHYSASLLLSLAFFTAPAVLVLDPMIDANNTRQIESAVQETIDTYRSAYLDMIRFDPRFKAAKKHIQQRSFDGKVDMVALEEAIRHTYNIDQSNRSFFENFHIEDYTGQAHEVAELVQYPQFAHLSRHLDSGLSQQQWMDLIRINWAYQNMLEVVPSLVTKEDASSIAVPDALRSTRDDLLKTPFSQTVINQYRNGQLSQKIAVAMIREWLYYRVRLVEMKTMNITPPLIFNMELIEQELMTQGRDESYWDYSPKDKR